MPVRWNAWALRCASAISAPKPLPKHCTRRAGSLFEDCMKIAKIAGSARVQSSLAHATFGVCRPASVFAKLGSITRSPTLQATALVPKAYLRLINTGHTRPWNSGAIFPTPRRGGAKGARGGPGLSAGGVAACPRRARGSGRSRPVRGDSAAASRGPREKNQRP